MKRRVVPIFGMEVWFGNDQDDAGEFLRKHGSDPAIIDDADGIWHSWTDKNDEGWRIMCIFDGQPGTVAHEAYHLACDLMEAIDAREMPPEEVKAHLIGWLVDEYHRTFSDKPKAPAPIQREDAA